MKICRYSLWLKVILAILLVGILALTSCNLFYSKTITINKGIVHFSFERSEGYSVENSTIKDDSEDKYTHIIITGPVGEDSINSVIGIYVRYPSFNFPDSLALWEYDMNMFKKFEGFETIDCSPVIVKVDSIQGNECGFYYTETSDLNRDLPDLVPVEMIYKGVYFDYDGLIWGITMLSSLADIEENQAHFGHILETFEILD